MKPKKEKHKKEEKPKPEKVDELLKAECNECDWKGYEYELAQDTVDEVPICPDCGSDNVYVYKESDESKK